jgi:4-diphosphocytidyl-2-C-methyl-D-erythritol kinase
VVSFSNCKINLGLNIVSKRNDGFHDLITCFYPINFYDVIEVVTATTFEFTSTGIPIYSAIENNLCVKAYTLLKKDFDALIPPVKLHLQKNIPTGAGIGGGSANASYVLKALQQKYNLPISNQALKNYAAQLGSDCPFFIDNTPSIATGRGEILTPFTIDLSTYQILLIFPDVHISTKDAFANIVPQQPALAIDTILQQPIETWKTNLCNDFEKPIFTKYPMLATIKEKLYTSGALYASMSGSGSTLYGIFEKTVDLKNIVDNYFDSNHYAIV